jgi:phosphoribosyl-ATP pyrophosphohydrolase/phosphoribosyl-AMP cyclohydrolase
MRTPDFSKGLLPAVVQDAHTQAVLMVGYMNEEAYQRTQATGQVTFFSRSKGRLWVKGETSGHYLKLVEMRVDCDGDAILVRALPMGPTCHRGTYSCFSEEGESNWELGSVLGHLWRLIEERAQGDGEGSYTAELLRQGLPRLTQKVGEEAIEVVIAALAQDKAALAAETADLLYHLWVLLKAAGLSPTDIEATLRQRHTRKEPNSPHP